ncbi:hypothetical protein PSTG_17319 [Puccinia striiformis f. sp. tritici PST-78]|uniref:DNA 3'-5' helicase n=1 Tax=Puccinia striiformis f. sp. tritici PST-78 TaxID=1165861 RepID=A0A0L0UQ59_9BASI|nr:hypothetical protein PSTG_17319 [Puccinia striiformis f. sp. tritici PST-78]
MLRHLQTPAIKKSDNLPRRIQLLKKIADKLSDKKEESLKAAIGALAQEKYKQPAKPLQIEAVYNLARGRNTFLLAGTGFGKSRIPEIYHTLLPKTSKGVILVLNPLDTLGNNQVLEKKNADFTAINLTKSNFNKNEANNVMKGKYNFVYLSPEIFLNSELWDQVYFSAEFQNRLALVVVDEAHIIYQWGIVESGGGKNKLILLGHVDDLGIFRPSYGKLGARLLTRNNKPILLMSATCRPIAIEGIKKSLKLESHNLSIVQGELTRHEIRIIRVHITESMASCGDLLSVFPSKAEWYTQSNIACYEGTGFGSWNSGNSMRRKSTFVRRFHSCTGEKDKVEVVEDFLKSKFPLISCTMALGMGQNWSRVRCVIQMGRTDPSSICQMIGRCGRDGRPGLAIIYAEPKRRGGKNSVDDFLPNIPQTNEDRMDALAITPVCLRIVFALDNSLGYIPLSKDDPNYKREQEREKKAGLAACMCSNCNPIAADGLMRHIKEMDKDNMDEMIVREDWPAAEPLITTTKRKRATAGSGGTNTTRKKNKLSLPLTLRKVAGGQTVPGQFEALYEAIEDFKSGPLANEELVRIEKETALHAVAMAEETEQAEVQAREKVTLDESKRIETEKSDTRLRIENDWKKEQQAHLKILIRRAGEEAERRGVQSIHRGRYSEDDGLLSGGSSSSPEIEDDVH